ncbi:MAG TPA: O-antigen ligase family protein [Candidatus Cybelea sp.]|nr:O-antigen ligase family protein [Candidatus Cybelea sp.]
MTYRPVIDHVAVPIYLDPFTAVLFAAAFIAAAAVTLRRPAYGLGALLIATPFDFSRDVFATTISLPKCVLLGVLLGLTAYPAVWRELRRAPAAAIFGALLLCLTATALSAAGAAHLGPVLRETLKWLQYAVLFAAAFYCYRLDGDDGTLLTCAALATIAVCLSALAQELAGAPSGLYIGSAIVPRIAGVLEGPNQLSAYCTIAAALLGAWAVVRPAAITALALGLLTCTDLLTFSRAGIVSLAIVFALVVLWGGRRAWRALRPALFGALAGAAGCAWWAIYAHTPGVLRISLAPSAYAGGVGNRGELWRAAWRMFLERPLLGVGAGNFELDLPEFGVYGVRTHANSWYLQSLAEGGIVLFGATLALIAAAIGAFARRPLIASLRAQPPWVLAAFAASLALALHQIVDDFVFYPKVGAPWFLLLGVAAAARRSV